MKRIKNLALIAAALCLAAGPLAALAGDEKPDAKPKLKPYILKTCPVSGDKLGEMGPAYVFEFRGREIKLCCKSCLKDFKKDSAKYLKKIEEAEAKEKAKAKDAPKPS